MGEDGMLTMVDGKKDMILVSGLNVYANEIEGVAALMPEVLECACVGVGDERTGEVPYLFMVPRSAWLGVETVLSHCRAHLAACKVPRPIAITDALPNSTIGKLLRKDLCARANGQASA